MLFGIGDREGKIFDTMGGMNDETDTNSTSVTAVVAPDAPAPVSSPQTTASYSQCRFYQR